MKTASTVIVSVERPRPRFALGKIWSTPSTLLLLKASGIDCRNLVERHAVGDWGDVSDCERQENEVAVKLGFCVLSIYRISASLRVWVFTEADRSHTVVSLREEHVLAVTEARAA